MADGRGFKGLLGLGGKTHMIPICLISHTNPSIELLDRAT